MRTVRRDIAQYNRDDEEDDTLEETGWKLVHGDVFRPPPHQMILVNMVGTGIQLLGMVGTVVCKWLTVWLSIGNCSVFAALGMLSPSSRGSLMSAAVFLFCFLGLISGYHAGRLYKTMKGKNPIRCAVQTGTLFPSLILGSGFLLNFFLISKGSSGAVGFLLHEIYALSADSLQHNDRPTFHVARNRSAPHLPRLLFRIP